MKISPPLAKEIRSNIENVLNRHVIILANDGTVTASDSIKDAKQWGTLDFLEMQDMQLIEKNSNQHMIIPIRYQSETVAAIIMSGERKEMSESASIIRSFAELFIQQYITTHQPTLDSTDQFISKLVTHATEHDLPLYETEARVLGYDFNHERVAIVIELSDFWNRCLDSFDQPTYEREDVIKQWKKNIEDKFRSFFSRSSDNIIAYTGNNRFVIFKTVDEDRDSVMKMLKQSFRAIFEPLKNASITSVSVGYSNPASGVSGLVRAYREAEVALTFGMRLWGENKSYYFGDLGILQIIGEGNKEKELAFANQLLEPLTNQELIHTLECFFDHNLNLTETSDKMGIHRNTVIYRLNQISEILGFDPRIFDHAMMIKLALLIRRLFA